VAILVTSWASTMFRRSRSTEGEKPLSSFSCFAKSSTERDARLTTIADLAARTAAYIRNRFDEPVDVVGNSFGGWQAMRLALAHPDLIDHLVLEAPAGLHDRDLSVAPRVFAREETAPAPGPHQQAHAEAYGAYGGGRVDAELAGRLSEIEAPTLLLLGTEDEMAPASAMRTIKAALPNCRFTYVYGAGHGLEYDAPDRVGRLGVFCKFDDDAAWGFSSHCRPGGNIKA